MLKRLQHSLTGQMLAALSLGAFVGEIIGSRPRNVLGIAVRQICDWASEIFQIGACAFAVPLIVSSIVLGLVGLEPMRGLRRMAWKAIGWSAASTALAGLTAWGFAVGCGFHPERSGVGMPNHLFDPFWLGLVVVSLAFGFYRNQIEEGHARLLVRFCQGLDEMLTRFVQWAMPLAPIWVFASAVSCSARQIALLASSDSLASPLVLAVLAGMAVYALVILPTALWLFTRINPWRYLRAMAPALLLASVCVSSLAILPLTFDRVRRVTGMSNRVASVTLSLCVALQCEGVVFIWLTFGEFIPKVGVPLRQSVPLKDSFMPEGPGWIVLMGSAAILVWSQACAAAVIAHSEGERNLLSPPPPKDPLAFDDLPAEGV